MKDPYMRWGFYRVRVGRWSGVNQYGGGADVDTGGGLCLEDEVALLMGMLHKYHQRNALYPPPIFADFCTLGNCTVLIFGRLAHIPHRVAFPVAVNLRGEHGKYSVPGRLNRATRGLPSCRVDRHSSMNCL